MDKENYVRLTRPAQRTAGGLVAVSQVYTSLWLGSDHLLSVETNGFTENYKRFYYRDIQAIVLRKTKRWVLWLAGWAVFLLAAGVSAYAAEETIGYLLAAIFAAVVAGFLGIGYLIKGTSTTGYLRTAVQTEELPSLRRLKSARKALDRLRPLIAAAQGTLPPEEFAQRLALLQGNGTSAIPLSTAASSPATSVPPGNV